jgi:predicted histidine transporter YuiF (NhaC family)
MPTWLLVASDHWITHLTVKLAIVGLISYIFICYKDKENKQKEEQKCKQKLKNYSTKKEKGTKNS